jgi:hypothetical protein
MGAGQTRMHEPDHAKIRGIDEELCVLRFDVALKADSERHQCRPCPDTLRLSSNRPVLEAQDFGTDEIYLVTTFTAPPKGAVAVALNSISLPTRIARPQVAGRIVAEQIGGLIHIAPRPNQWLRGPSTTSERAVGGAGLPTNQTMTQRRARLLRERISRAISIVAPWREVPSPGARLWGDPRR